MGSELHLNLQKQVIGDNHDAVQILRTLRIYNGASTFMCSHIHTEAWKFFGSCEVDPFVETVFS